MANCLRLALVASCPLHLPVPWMHPVHKRSASLKLERPSVNNSSGGNTATRTSYCCQCSTHGLGVNQLLRLKQAPGRMSGVELPSCLCSSSALSKIKIRQLLFLISKVSKTRRLRPKAPSNLNTSNRSKARHSASAFQNSTSLKDLAEPKRPPAFSLPVDLKGGRHGQTKQVELRQTANSEAFPRNRVP